MNPLTTGLAVASILGTFSQITANDDFDARLISIKNATQNEQQQAMINKLQTDMNQMQMQERLHMMQKVQEEMPDIAKKIRSQLVAQKIKEIKSANPMQRKELMNNFKKELAQMKNKERAEAIVQMRKEMNQKQNQTKEQKTLPGKVQDINKNEILNQSSDSNQFLQGVPESGFQPGSQGFGPN